MKKTWLAILIAMMLLAFTACGNKDGASSTTEDSSAATEEAATPSEWTLEGTFIDEAGNGLIIYHMTTEAGYDEEGWSVSIFTTDGDLFGGALQDENGTLTGDFVGLDDEGNETEAIPATVTADGENVVLNYNGNEYHFTPYVEDASNDAASADASSDAVPDLLPFFQYTGVFGYDNVQPDVVAAYDYLAFDKSFEMFDGGTGIPYVQIIAVDDADAADSLIYGDYYLWQFELEDDTLVAISGGHCPGIMHAERVGEGETAIYTVTSLDEAMTDDDAEAIFGDYYEEYVKVASDDEGRDKAVAQLLSDYVKANGLNATRYSFGDEVKDLP